MAQALGAQGGRKSGARGLGQPREAVARERCVGLTASQEACDTRSVEPAARCAYPLIEQGKRATTAAGFGGGHGFWP